MNTNEITNGITAGVEARKERGQQIADLAHIEKKGGYWLVPSVTNPNQTKYKVTLNGDFRACDCLDHETRGCKCKHIYAVEFYLSRSHNNDGTETVTGRVTITQKRQTYPQDWPNYNAAQQNEKREFQRLLHDLCRDIPTPPQVGRGQRRLPMPDAIFSAVFKVYCTMSARRFTSDLCDAQAKGYIEKVPHFNSVLNYLENPDLYPILHSMIERASLPLAGVEENFAFDSTGFATSRFVRWFDIKYNKFTSEQQWVKAHIACGVKTNVVTAIEIHGKDANDNPILPSLVKATRKNFTMKEGSADKGYSTRDSHDAIAEAGATPYIMFKNNSTGGVGGLYEKMFHFFQFKRDEFLTHYHRRSNIESTVMMIKTKFGDSLRSKTDAAQRNETLCKVLCHNICCLISAIYELGIDPVFTEATGCTTKHLTAQQNVI